MELCFWISVGIILINMLFQKGSLKLQMLQAFISVAAVTHMLTGMDLKWWMLFITWASSRQNLSLGFLWLEPVSPATETS